MNTKVGSSLIVYNPDKVRIGDYTTTLTPTGDGNITLPEEFNEIEDLDKRLIEYL